MQGQQKKKMRQWPGFGTFSVLMPISVIYALGEALRIPVDTPARDGFLRGRGRNVAQLVKDYEEDFGQKMRVPRRPKITAQADLLDVFAYVCSWMLPGSQVMGRSSYSKAIARFMNQQGLREYGCREQDLQFASFSVLQVAKALGWDKASDHHPGAVVTALDKLERYGVLFQVTQGAQARGRKHAIAPLYTWGSFNWIGCEDSGWDGCYFEWTGSKWDSGGQCGTISVFNDDLGISESMKSMWEALAQRWVEKGVVSKVRVVFEDDIPGMWEVLAQRWIRGSEVVVAREYKPVRERNKPKITSASEEASKTKKGTKHSYSGGKLKTKAAAQDDGLDYQGQVPELKEQSAEERQYSVEMARRAKAGILSLEDNALSSEDSELGSEDNPG